LEWNVSRVFMGLAMQRGPVQFKDLVSGIKLRRKLALAVSWFCCGGVTWLSWTFFATTDQLGCAQMLMGGVSLGDVWNDYQDLTSTIAWVRTEQPRIPNSKH
jgi:hypothetical protein